MNRLSYKNYQRRTMLAMSVYVALLLMVWPLARDASSLPLKIFFALVPVVPVLYVIWLMGWRIRLSDELEQRTHLIGLGVATAIVSVFSLIGGFLANAKVLTLETSAMVLLWVFPVLVVSYSIARARVARRYGVVSCEETESGMPLYVHFLIAALIVGMVGIYAYFHAADEKVAGLASGMTTAFALAAVYFWVRRRLHQRSAESAE
jgi:hypothetical protein